MNYFETGWNYQLLSTFAAKSVVWGKHHVGEAVNRGLLRHMIRGLVVGSPMGGGHRLPLCGHHRRAWVSSVTAQGR